MSKLKELIINQEGILPSFDKDIYEYYLTVPEEINQIDINAIPEDINSQVEIIGNTNLIYGENKITIRVNGEKDSTDYNINVVKTNNYEATNNNLEILSVEGELLEPPFESSITEYKIEVLNEVKNLNILAIPENENAQIEIKRSL